VNSIEKVNSKVRAIVTNKGNIRLYVVASLIWMAITGLLFWKPPLDVDASIPDDNPLAHTFLDDRISEECRGLGDINNPQPYIACADRAEGTVRAEASSANTRQMLTWAGIVLFFPLVLPLTLFGIAVVIQWISDGYGGSTKA
jgi:hypothetical protein